MIVYFSRFSSRARKGVLIINPEPSRLVVGREPLKGAETPLKDDYLYFGSVSELPDPKSVGRANLILFEDERIAPAFLERNQINIMLTSSEEEYDRLCAEMRAVFDIQMQVNIFSSKLLLLVQDEARAEKLLELGYQAFGNPLLLFDTSLCLLASAGTESVEDDPVMEHALTKGYMPEQYLEEVMKEESGSPEEDKVLIIWEKDFLKHRLIAGRIVRGNRLVGYLKLFEYNRPLTEMLDTEMLKILCQYLALSMDSIVASHQSGSPFIETFLLDIIERKLVNHEVIQERVALYNLELQSFKTAIIVEIEERFRKMDKLYLLKQMMQTHFKRSTAFIRGTDIVILYDQNTPEALYTQSHLEDFRRLLQANYCRAAFSLPFRKLDSFYTYLQQATACFQVADRLRVTERILMYEDFLVAHMLLRFGEVFDLHDLVSPAVRRLRKLDTQKGSSLTETLFSYIRHCQDITVTSKAMHVHYNTLKYRIGRIREITGIDFDSETEIFRIMLSQRAIDLLRRTEDNDTSPLES
ncbi:MAG: helix-turn-helix domain-containing protein [Coriobacteriales bacterium]|jgi:sugar diacid utilization regulator|nr:helix-turn-helix domain-containing protein [Coriobacteriales bacterium]